MERGKTVRLTIQELIEKLISVREVYRYDYKKFQQEKETKKNSVRNDFKAGTPRYNSELEKIEKDFKKSIDELKDECRSVYIPLIEELEVQERTRASTVNRHLIEEVKLFQDMTLTADEFGALLHRYGNKDYYVDRVLESIAEKNGITTNGRTVTGEPLRIEPSLATKLQILAELKEQADYILNKYGTPEEDTKARIGALFPSVLQRAEMLYTNGLCEDGFTSRQIAIRVVDSIRANPGNGYKIINNAFANGTQATKNALLFTLSGEKDSVVMNAVKRSDLFSEVNRFSEDERTKYIDAENGIAELHKCSTDNELMREVILKHNANKYFSEMLESDKGLIDSYVME